MYKNFEIPNSNTSTGAAPKWVHFAAVNQGWKNLGFYRFF